MSTITPGPRGTQALKLALRFRDDPIGAFRDLASTYGEVVRFSLGGQTTFLLSGPDTATHVLVAKQENYSRVNYPAIDEMMGVGLFTSTGPTWFRNRALAQPLFAARRLPDYADTLAAAARRTADAWADTPLPRTVDVMAEMRKLALEAVCRALFGADTSDHSRALEAAITAFETTTAKVLRSPLALILAQSPGIGPTRAWHLQFRRRRTVLGAAREFDRVIDEILARRVDQGPTESADLLGQLLGTRDPETGKPLTRQEIRDEVTTFMLAAHDTTGLTMTWMWYLLAANPQAREKLEAEVAEVLGGRTPTAADAENLPWTRAVISETMRMYPAVWALDRTAVADDEVLGHHIPAGSRVLIIPPVNHQDTRWWPDPERFDPTRFLPGNDIGRPRTAYLPFGGGRRICIGAGFAMLEATISAVTLVQRFRIDLPPGATVTMDAGVVLAPKGGLPMRVSAATMAPVA